MLRLLASRDMLQGSRSEYTVGVYWMEATSRQDHIVLHDADRPLPSHAMKAPENFGSEVSLSSSRLHFAPRICARP